MTRVTPRRSTADWFNITVIAFGVNHKDFRAREESPEGVSVVERPLDCHKIRHLNVSCSYDMQLYVNT